MIYKFVMAFHFLTDIDTYKPKHNYQTSLMLGVNFNIPANFKLFWWKKYYYCFCYSFKKFKNLCSFIMIV